MPTRQTSEKQGQHWDDPVDEVSGLGPVRARFLKSRDFNTVGDLLLRAPLRFIDRRQSPPFNQLLEQQGGEITAIGVIESFGEKGARNKRRLLVNISDGKGYVTGVWFTKYWHLIPKLKPDSKIALSGKLTFFDGPQIVHPQITFLDEMQGADAETGLIPVYPSGEEWEKIGLGRRGWHKLIVNLIDAWDGSGPYLPEEVRSMEKLPTLPEAIRGIHIPNSTDEFDRAMEGLKFTELFHHQLLMVALRRRRKQGEGINITEGGQRYRSFIAGLPFKLAEGQERTQEEIQQDFVSGHPMHRLLQGEVGSGKTVVALGAATIAADSGYQTALMAPTELLARQHYRNASEWFDQIGLKAVLIAAGRHPEENRRALHEASTGGADLVIGTHALFQERVILKNLGLAIIDEQQRFGVRQRARLVGKGIKPHVLLMTATPIPRTLALAHYGDLDLSFIPPLAGRKRRVKTRTVNDGSRDKVFTWLREKLLRGASGYLVFPVIDEGVTGLEAAEARFEPYRRIDFKGIPIALLHGRQPVEERILAMEAFRKGEIRLLMATAVVEVGVDVPRASLMVIENSERFGLSQLHQLRGRIGRDGKPAVCVLMTPEIPGQGGFQRLKTLETCDDGLALAEEDLRLRGSGEPLGARQSGIVRFRLADLASDQELLKRAHLCAEWLLDLHPDLAPYPDLRRKLRHDYRSRPRTLLAG